MQTAWTFFTFNAVPRNRKMVPCCRHLRQVAKRLGPFANLNLSLTWFLLGSTWFHSFSYVFLHTPSSHHFSQIIEVEKAGGEHVQTAWAFFTFNAVLQNRKTGPCSRHSRQVAKRLGHFAKLRLPLMWFLLGSTWFHSFSYCFLHMPSSHRLFTVIELEKAGDETVQKAWTLFTFSAVPRNRKTVPCSRHSRQVAKRLGTFAKLSLPLMWFPLGSVWFHVV